MTTTEIKLSDSARVILSNASQHEHCFANPAALKIPAAARMSVINGLIKRGLLEEVHPTRDAADLAFQTPDGPRVAQITEEGMRAIGLDPDEGKPGESDASGIEGGVPGGDGAPEGAAGPAQPLFGDSAEVIEQKHREAGTLPAQAPKPATGLRGAVVAFLAAWDAAPGEDATDNAISRSVAALRAALAEKPAKAAGEPRAPREGTKQEAVIAMLRREGGTTIAAIEEATGWQPHTVRGFFAGLKKKGLEVTSTKVAKTDEAPARSIYRI